jgi:hypothetical protein
MTTPPTSTRHTPNLNIRNMTFLSKPDIQISVLEERGTSAKFIKSYSTLDKIEGTATISTKTDTKFDDLEITFVGE